MNTKVLIFSVALTLLLLSAATFAEEVEVPSDEEIKADIQETVEQIAKLTRDRRHEFARRNDWWKNTWRNTIKPAVAGVAQSVVDELAQNQRK